MYGIQTKASNTYRELSEEEEISALSLALSPVCHLLDGSVDKGRARTPTS